MPSADLASIIAAAERLRGFPAKAKQAVQRAVSNLRRALPVEARRDIQTEYKLPAARIADNLSVSSSDTTITLTGAARTVGLIEFGGRWGGRKTAGANAQVFVGEASHNYGGTFIAVGKNGNRQIFSRIHKGGRLSPRLPIKALYGPSIASMLRKPGRADRLADFAQSKLAAEISRLL